MQGKQYCRVCDGWVTPAEGEKHARAHKKEVKELVKKKTKEAEQRRQEGLARYREEKRLEKESVT